MLLSSGLYLYRKGRRQQPSGQVQQPLLHKQDVQKNPSGPQVLLTKPHYYVITFVILKQTSYLANPLCYRAAHPCLEQELTSKGIKRRRRLLKGSLEISFYSRWLPAPCPPFPFPRCVVSFPTGSVLFCLPGIDLFLCCSNGA